MDCSTPDLPFPSYLPEFAQVHVHLISDAIQQSHPLSSSSLRILEEQAWTEKEHQGTSLAVQWLGLQALATIPGQGTKTPQGMWCGQK